MKRICTLVGMLVYIACPFAHAQTIVFEMPGLATAFQITEGTEYADSATLGGTDRFVTEASLSVFSNIARTGDATFSLYSAIPVDPIQPGQPGVTPGPLAAFQPSSSALASVSLTGVAFAAGSSTELIFSGIDTLVGDDLFWAVEFKDISNLSGSGGFGPLFGNAAALASTDFETDPSRLYSRSEELFGNAWLVTSVPSQTLTSSLAVKITAVPEPAVSLLAVLGAMGLLRRRRTA